MQCVVDAYVNGGGPFDGIVSKIGPGGQITFENPAVEQAKWAAWIRAGMPAATR